MHFVGLGRTDIIPYSVCSEDYDNLEFPLVFTNNSLADPTLDTDSMITFRWDDNDDHRHDDENDDCDINDDNEYDDSGDDDVTLALLYILLW